MLRRDCKYVDRFPDKEDAGDNEDDDGGVGDKYV